PVPVNYQWQRNDGAGFGDIAGATGSSWSLLPTAADMMASFRVVVTVPATDPNQSLISGAVNLVEGPVPGTALHFAFDGDYCSGAACLTGGSPAGAEALPPLVDDSPSGAAGDQSASFNGTAAGGIGYWYDASGMINYDDQDYTLEAWVKIGEGGPSPGNAKGLILGYGIPGGYSMWIREDGTIGGTTYGIVDLFTSAVVPATGWHHVAQVHQIGTEVRFYIDGELAQVLPETRGVNPTTDNNLYVGYERGSGAPLNPFNGLIDRVRISGSALTPEEFDLTPGPLGLGMVAYWPFDGNLADPVGGHDGVGHGSEPIAFDAGMFGQGVDLDPSLLQYVEAGAPEADFDMGGGSVSMSMWFRVDNFDVSWQALIAKGEGTNYRLARRAETGTIGYAGGVGEPAQAAPDVNDGEIHHVVALTRAGVQTELWIDGTLYEVGANPTITDNDQPLLIGANPDTSPLRYWNGLIDDVGVWSRALSAAEIAKLWNGGAGASIGDLV
ncbi:MAG: LamG domain-containing protein, partial [Verrucomicrobiae bacterium]|nr:LamG domain-containing protein [Verrucomicrobiae bacterium]